MKLFEDFEQLQNKNRQIATERLRFYTIFNLAPVGFLVVDASGIIVQANLASAVLFIYPSEGMIGNSIESYIDPQDRMIFSDCRVQARTGEKKSIELTMMTSLGKRFPARLETVQTKQAELFVAITDISKYKDAMDALTAATDELQVTVGQLRNETVQRQRAEDELRKFTRKLIEAQENERHRIAQELHDHVGQLMTYHILLLEKARKQLDPEIYQDAKSVAQEVLMQIRDLSTDLRPSMLRSVGLIPSLLALFDRYKTITNVRVDHEFDLVEDRTLGDTGVTAYRIVQEALTNVVRHADVNEVKVRLTVYGSRLRICVEDHGKGFNLNEGLRTTGLTGMRERAQAIGGDLSINSRPGQGTGIIAELPLLSE